MTGIALVLIGYFWFYQNQNWEIAATICIVTGALLAGARADYLLKNLVLRREARYSRDDNTDLPDDRHDGGRNCTHRSGR